MRQRAFAATLPSITVLWLLGCGEAPTPIAEPSRAPVIAAPTPLAPEVAAAHARAESARAVIATHCGLCHLPEDSRDPRALGIFDLTDPDWTAGLDARQLADLETRLVDGDAPFEDIDAVRSFLVDVWQRRDATEPVAC